VTLGTAGVAANTPTINGMDADPFDGAGEVGRRLQDDASIDICAEAMRNSGEDVRAHRQAIEELGREDLILRQECERRQRYPAFYERCDETDMCVGVEVRSFEPSVGVPSTPATVTTSGAAPQELSVIVMVAVLLFCRPS